MVLPFDQTPSSPLLDDLLIRVEDFDVQRAGYPVQVILEAARTAPHLSIATATTAGIIRATQKGECAMTQLAPSPLADLLLANRKEILRLARQHGASNVRVFGSVVRGDVTGTSDIDLLVTWDYGNLSPWGGIGLHLDLADLLGCAVDVIGDDELHWYIRERVLAEAVPL